MENYLLDDCWEQIFKRVDNQDDLDAISLVSKRFLSISSGLKKSLTISDLKFPLPANFYNLSQRFRFINRIHICLPFRYRLRDVDDLVFKIARSGLDIKEVSLTDLSEIPVKGLKELGSTMKNLKTLTCTRCVLKDVDLIAIVQSLPSLKEVNISHFFDGVCMSDTWTQELASKLKHAVISASDANGFHALRYCSHLNSLTVSDVRSPATFTIDNTLSYSRALCSLEFRHSDISDAIISSIMKANLPLKKLKLRECTNITPSGLSTLLRQYQSLAVFEFLWSPRITDQDMDHLSKYLGRATRIDLSGCSKLTNSTFFALAKRCPLLLHIQMYNTSLGEEGDITHVDLKKNSELRFLDLGNNESLNGQTFERIGHVCPNLQMIDLSSFWSITEERISEVLTACPGIRHFKVNKCKLETVLGKYSEHSELNIEVLEAEDAMMNDTGMAMIAMRCPRLLKLNVSCCKKVTVEGVLKVVEKCHRLMEIDLRYCFKVRFDVMPWIWMMSERPSLRKIIPPYGKLPIWDRRELFMRYGCRLL